MLAMEAQAPRAFGQPTSSLTTIASKPAPTRKRVPCRSEHARDGGPGTAGIWTASIIVADHRGQARSYKKRMTR